jgi:hypothetical protein
MNPMSSLLTKSDVADRLAVSVRSVDRLRARDLLPALKVLGTIRFRAEDVESLIDALRHQGPASR